MGNEQLVIVDIIENLQHKLKVAIAVLIEEEWSGCIHDDRGYVQKSQHCPQCLFNREERMHDAGCAWDEALTAAGYDTYESRERVRQQRHAPPAMSRFLKCSWCGGAVVESGNTDLFKQPLYVHASDNQVCQRKNVELPSAQIQASASDAEVSRG